MGGFKQNTTLGYKIWGGKKGAEETSPASKERMLALSPLGKGFSRHPKYGCGIQNTDA
jgi:hypothetical protein